MTSSDLPGFSHQMIANGSVNLSIHVGGTGPALVLLHGFPQNHMAWAGLVPELSKHFTCIVPDLRGYGDSDAPHDDPDHVTYSKRVMAQDLAAVLDHFDLRKAHVLGHDRGARVAYRFALDHPDRIEKLGILEILPTSEYWDAWGAVLGLAAYHWTFLAQPSPLPERMINADPQAYIDWTLQSWTLNKSLDPFPASALASYRRQSASPARIHAMCADYRSGASYDRKLDEDDKANGNKIKAPVMFLYSDHGFPARIGSAETIWQNWAEDVRTQSCTCGHFVMEENPAAVLDCFLPFFTSP